MLTQAISETASPLLFKLTDRPSRSPTGHLIKLCGSNFVSFRDTYF